MSLYDQLIQEGKSLGIQEGIEKGFEKGKNLGMQEGKNLGLQEGIELSIEKTILNAFDNGYDINAIRLITGESLQKIKNILAKNGR